MPRPSALAIIFVILTSIVCSAQLRNPFPKPEAAQNVVREFCRLDYQGARLSPEGWARVKPLTTWSDNPAWRYFEVISRYDQLDDNTSLHSARVTVRYLRLGSFEMGVGFTPARDTQDVQFSVKEIDQGWRIDTTDPDPLQPQVSKSVAVQWLQAKLKTSTDPGEKASIESALKQLQPK
jgi:hypothetical protein